MTIRNVNVRGYYFEGPYDLNSPFNNVAGIYLITKNNGSIVDVGETEELGDRITNHERKDCWVRNSGINLWFHSDSNSQTRIFKETFLRDRINPVCGEI